MSTVREYRGVLIHRNTSPHLIRWWSLGTGTMLAADTLAGMRALIRDAHGVTT